MDGGFLEGFFSGEIYLDISDIDQFLEISFDIMFFFQEYLIELKKNEIPKEVVRTKLAEPGPFPMKSSPMKSMSC